jgi:hypothetical protein
LAAVLLLQLYVFLSHLVIFSHFVAGFLDSIIILITACHCLSGPCSDTNSTTCMALSLNHSYALPLLCPTPEEMDNLTAAIKRGDISWHGEPFNFEVENMAPELFEAGLSQVHHSLTRPE